MTSRANKITEELMTINTKRSDPKTIREERKNYKKHLQN